ncbi:N-acetylneuraminate epimerase [Aliivibrio kagoshimensis]|uniref:N-acetylneuraminate epimerase n=1 Tax=Aliivibrio kagoshimensis TaxID=2910230 RepID=UPI003D12B3FA
MNNPIYRSAKTLLLLSAAICSTQLLAANEKWPNLPEGIKSGVAVQSDGQLFVGLGSAGQHLYTLDLDNVDQGWQQLPDFIGPARNGATATVTNGKIMIFGGAGKVNASDRAPIIFNSVYSFDIKNSRWAEEKTSSPVGLLGASSYTNNNGEVIVVGGYNKSLFDTYLSDITAVDKKTDPVKWQKIVDDYMGMKPQDYRWNTQVLSYSAAENKWRDLGTSPYIPNCGSALVLEQNTATLVSGEIKPGLRTAEVKSIQVSDGNVTWKTMSALPKPAGQSLQEGVAGAYAGKIGDALVVMGGANFHGARDQFEQGGLFAHNGLSKAYNPEVYVMNGSQWKQVNDLPKGMAYGASFTLPEGILVVGGENKKREALNDVFLVTLNESGVSITD